MPVAEAIRSERRSGRMLMRLACIALALTNALAWGQTCKVLDEDIATAYVGDCENGLAHGVGEAQGRDSYRGGFKAGRKHGQGIYRWADGSSFEGAYSEDGHGEGFGTYREPLRIHRPDKIVGPVRGRIVGNEYVARGYWEANGRLMRDCESASGCALAIAIEESTATQGINTGVCSQSGLAAVDPRYLGIWRGRWDDRWPVELTVRQGRAPAHVVVTYRWEEVAGKPMSRRLHSGCMVNPALIVDNGGLELLLSADVPHAATLSGRFASPRRARLTKDNGASP